MLLHRQHVDREDKLCCREHLDEQALSSRDVGILVQRCRHRQWAREQVSHNGSGGNGTDDLSWHHQDSTKNRDSTYEAQTERDLEYMVSSIPDEVLCTACLLLD